MAPVSLRARLSHMLEAIAFIEANKSPTFEECRQDRFRQLGIERCLEIVSEASRHIPDEIKTRRPDIPRRRVGDFGNRLRHAYS
jgi:uncharacterized protein with HEPN domain